MRRWLLNISAGLSLLLAGCCQTARETSPRTLPEARMRRAGRLALQTAEGDQISLRHLYLTLGSPDYYGHIPDGRRVELFTGTEGWAIVAEFTADGKFANSISWIKLIPDNLENLTKTTVEEREQIIKRAGLLRDHDGGASGERAAGNSR